MSSINSIQSGSGAVPSTSGSGASGELAKFESQLSDWVHCPSCKTPEGKAKIAEITSKIDAIKNEMKRVEETKASSHAADAEPAAISAPRSVRFDGLGAWVNTQA
jgi:hypothetical protein